MTPNPPEPTPVVSPGAPVVSPSAAPESTVASPAPSAAPLVPASAEELVKIIGKYRVRITRSKCIGAASCVAIAPEVFVLDEETIVKFVESDNPSSSELLLAAQSCPTAALEIIDQETGQKLWPLG
jgi:ferredoxin